MRVCRMEWVDEADRVQAAWGWRSVSVERGIDELLLVGRFPLEKQLSSGPGPTSYTCRSRSHSTPRLPRYYGTVGNVQKGRRHDQPEEISLHFFRPPSLLLALDVYMTLHGTRVHHAGNSATCTCTFVLLLLCGVFGSNCEWPRRKLARKLPTRWDSALKLLSVEICTLLLLCCAVLCCAVLSCCF